ncbi:hypothetical protein DdX_14682 [Ditylenchus destructor]|uniref:Uncharacterized protein n=1 Tax=Ditylenchus destructor TaxID=166010 RepID=A0AAD4QVD8_9BILA|nr:hypothetical protein DdX_14682 [Ditylenchus destructor]
MFRSNLLALYLRDVRSIARGISRSVPPREQVPLYYTMQSRNVHTLFGRAASSGVFKASQRLTAMFEPDHLEPIQYHIKEMAQSDTAVNIVWSDGHKRLLPGSRTVREQIFYRERIPEQIPLLSQEGHG